MRKIKRAYAILFIVAFLLGNCTPMNKQNQKPVKQADSFHVYLLMGQSNMAGRAPVEPGDEQTHPRVLMLDKNNMWTPAKDPLRFDKPIAGVGPGLSFGKRIAQADRKITIGLVPCAAGGSPIDAWKGGGYHDQTNSYPYDEAIKRARIAMQAGQLKGVIWHQGESDSKPGRAETYGQKLHELIEHVRKDLDSPELPFIVATLPDFFVAKAPLASQINGALQALPGQVPHTACISTADLTHIGDTTHFDTPSARELGRRYARAMQELQKNTSVK
jgi:hypothetical protein